MVARLVHIHHTFGHADKVLALLGCLTIEAAVEFGLSTVVLGNPGNGGINDFAGILSRHQHFAQLDGRWQELNFQLLRLTVNGNLSGTVAHVRHHNALLGLLTLQHEEAVLIGHYRQAVGRHAGTCHRLTR